MAEMAGLALVALVGVPLGWALAALVDRGAKVVPWWVVATALGSVLAVLWLALVILLPLVVR